MRELTFKEGIKDCVPTLLGYISIGIACGVVGIATHLSVLEITLLAMFVYAGAAQFIICALIAINSPISAIILTTFIVNLRHFLLSMTIAPYFMKESLMKNIGFGTLLTDESFGVAINKVNKVGYLSPSWMNGLNITAYAVWVLSCFLGALFGKWIKNPEVFGLDYALTAMFIALLVLTLEHIPKNKLTLYLKLILYVVISMYILTFFLPSYIAILLSTVFVASIGVMNE